MTERHFTPEEIEDARFYIVRLADIRPRRPQASPDEMLAEVHPEDKERFLRGRDTWLAGAEVQEYE
jgi:hypothetical protein